MINSPGHQPEACQIIQSALFLKNTNGRELPVPRGPTIRYTTGLRRVGDPSAIRRWTSKMRHVLVLVHVSLSCFVVFALTVGKPNNPEVRPLKWSAPILKKAEGQRLAQKGLVYPLLGPLAGNYTQRVV